MGIIDVWALLGTGIVIALAYGLRRGYRAVQRAYQLRYDEGFVCGLAQAGRLAYVQGHEDGLVEGRAQAGREQTISAEKAYDKGYERGQLDLLATFEQADHLRDERPAMSA